MALFFFSFNCYDAFLRKPLRLILYNAFFFSFLETVHKILSNAMAKRKKKEKKILIQQLVLVNKNILYYPNLYSK